MFTRKHIRKTQNIKLWQIKALNETLWKNKKIQSSQFGQSRLPLRFRLPVQSVSARKSGEPQIRQHLLLRLLFRAARIQRHGQEIATVVHTSPFFSAVSTHMCSGLCLNKLWFFYWYVKTPFCLHLSISHRLQPNHRIEESEAKPRSRGGKAHSRT